MKKQIAFFLMIVLILSLCGCSFGSDAKNPVVFYYPWSNLEEALKQDPRCTAIGSETRDISGNRDSLQYLLTLYFRGPQDASLMSPFPAGTSALHIETADATLTLTLNSAFAQLKGIDLTTACICLARTCFDLEDVQTVLIKAVTAEDLLAVDMTITRDSVLLTDSLPETNPTE